MVELLDRRGWQIEKGDRIRIKAENLCAEVTEVRSRHLIITPFDSQVTYPEKTFSIVHNSEGIEILPRCPECESYEVTTNNKRIEFKYGNDSPPVMLEAVVPIHTCECCYEWMDSEAGDIQDEVVKRHLRRTKR